MTLPSLFILVTSITFALAIMSLISVILPSLWDCSSLAGEETDWIIKILFPLIFSFISTYISPSANFLILEFTSFDFKYLAIFLLRILLLFPVN